LRLVVFGWGNDARGDDGLGPLLLARVARAGWRDVTTIEDFQLQIEHALDLDGAEAALFLDAGKETPAPFLFTEVAPRRSETFTTHALAPEAVLDVFARSLAKTPPPSFALCVRGERFELGEGLSAEAAERLETAWDFVQGLMRDRAVEAWRRAARLYDRGAPNLPDDEKGVGPLWGPGRWSVERDRMREQAPDLVKPPA
jgi:hydrogenase maturation protease